MLFKNSPISYSKFLQSKEDRIHVHALTTVKDPAVDVEFFRRSISLHYQHVYATKKWQNGIYRFIFFGFGLLFLAFAAIIFFKTVNFTCGIYFKDCALVKNYINVICLFLAGCAFITGYKIHPEKDAMHYLIGKVEREGNCPEKHLQIEFNAIIANLSPEYLTSPHMLWINKTLKPLH
jgi:hypothetical protein